MEKEEEIRKEIYALEQKMEGLDERENERAKMRKQTLKDIGFYLILFASILAILFVVFLCISCSIDDLTSFIGDETKEENELVVESSFVTNAEVSIRGLGTSIEKISFVLVNGEKRLQVEDECGKNLFEYQINSNLITIISSRGEDITIGTLGENSLTFSDNLQIEVYIFNKVILDE